MYNNKDLQVHVHPIVESGDRQCTLRTRLHLAKLSLASTPLMVERESKKRSISVRCFTFPPAAPLMVTSAREIEARRGASQ